MKNKIMELRNTAVAKRKEAQSFAASADITSAKASLEEAKNADAEADMLQEILDSTPAVPEVTVKPENKKDPVHEFAQAVRRGFKNINNETTGADGGYTVPEDIQTRIEKYREAKFSLVNLIRKENVTTNKGRRTFQTKAQHAGFSKVAEAASIGAVNGPQFSILNYAIDKFAGYLPVTNELLEDSDANITAVMVEWLGEEAIATDTLVELEKEPYNASEYSMLIPALRDRYDFPDIAMWLAPKPYLFLAGTRDKLFPKDAVEDCYSRMQGYYSGSPAPGALNTLFFDGEHHCGKAEQSIIVAHLDSVLRKR